MVFNELGICNSVAIIPTPRQCKIYRFPFNMKSTAFERKGISIKIALLFEQCRTTHKIFHDQSTLNFTLGKGSSCLTEVVWWRRGAGGQVVLDANHQCSIDINGVTTPGHCWSHKAYMVNWVVFLTITIIKVMSSVQSLNLNFKIVVFWIF